MVMLTSGFNNVSPGDGKGHLYVLNAYTGIQNTSQISSVATGSLHGTGDISTNTGSSSSPSGLARIFAQIVLPKSDATVQEVYGGDELGNLWRFDVNGNVGGTTSGGGFAAQLLTTLSVNSVIQPIYSKPVVSSCQGQNVVIVGTGRLLSLSTDVPNSDQQSLYGIMDPLTNTSSPNTIPIYQNAPENNSSFVQQAVTLGYCTATEGALGLCTAADSTTTPPVLAQPVVTEAYPPQAVSYPAQSGWYVNLPTPKERINTDPTLIFNTLVVNSNIPNSSSCSVGGSSLSYAINACTGGAVNTPINDGTSVYSVVGASTNVVISTTIAADGSKLVSTSGNSLTNSPICIDTPNGKIVCTSHNSNGTDSSTTPPPKTSSTVSTESWLDIPRP